MNPNPADMMVSSSTSTDPTQRKKDMWSEKLDESKSGNREGLHESIAKEGVLEPVKIKHDDGAESHIADGHHRVAAANDINPDMEVPVEHFVPSQLPKQTVDFQNMPAPTGPQFIPQEHHDWAWEVSLQPELDQEYTRKDGTPELKPGHLHFDDRGNPYPASSTCSGRHGCPPATQKMRQSLALGKFQKSQGIQRGFNVNQQTWTITLTLPKFKKHYAMLPIWVMMF